VGVVRELSGGVSGSGEPWLGSVGVGVLWSVQVDLEEEDLRLFLFW